MEAKTDDKGLLSFRAEGSSVTAFEAEGQMGYLISVLGVVLHRLTHGLNASQTFASYSLLLMAAAEAGKINGADDHIYDGAMKLSLMADLLTATAEKEENND